MFSTVSEHSRVVSSTWKNVRALDCFSCYKIFLRAGNNPVVLKNSTEHAEPLFIALLDDRTRILKSGFNISLSCIGRCTKESQTYQLGNHGHWGATILLTSQMDHAVVSEKHFSIREMVLTHSSNTCGKYWVSKKLITLKTYRFSLEEGNLSNYNLLEKRNFNLEIGTMLVRIRYR